MFYHLKKVWINLFKLYLRKKSAKKVFFVSNYPPPPRPLRNDLKLPTYLLAFYGLLQVFRNSLVNGCYYCHGFLDFFTTVARFFWDDWILDAFDDFGNLCDSEMWNVKWIRLMSGDHSLRYTSLAVFGRSYLSKILSAGNDNSISTLRPSFSSTVYNCWLFSFSATRFDCSVSRVSRSIAARESNSLLDLSISWSLKLMRLIPILIPVTK